MFIRSGASVTVIASFVLGGCAGPMVRYEKAKPEDYNIKSGQIVFGIRRSDIAIVEAPRKKPEKEEVDPDCRAARPVRTKDWATCLDRIAVNVTPGILDEPVYVARPGDSWSWLRHTKLSATSLDDDLPNVDTITVAYSDDTTQFVTSVGSGATVGLAFGPWGALAGALVGAGGAVASGRQWSALQNFAWAREDDTWEKRVCPDPLVPDMKAYLHDADTVPLSAGITPYLIPLEKDTGCWHALSIGRSVEPRPPKTAGRFSGWLYRFVLGDVPTGAVRRDDPKTAQYFDGSPQAVFPYVPCQGATLMMTWVDELKSISDSKAVAYRSYAFNVANPEYLRFADLPKGGTIKLGANCNAQVAFGSYTGSTAQSDVDALLKQVGDFKAAQGK